MAAWITLVSAIGGIVAGGTFTYFTSRSQLYIQAEHAYDLALRDLRIPHYQSPFSPYRKYPKTPANFRNASTTGLAQAQGAASLLVLQ
jgi:predicted ribosomally synthesized peptide with SipW-like signal peptide